MTEQHPLYLRCKECGILFTCPYTKGKTKCWLPKTGDIEMCHCDDCETKKHGSEGYYCGTSMFKGWKQKI